MSPPATILASVLVLGCAAPLIAQSTSATPTPSFADPARRAKLAAAFDRIRDRMPEAVRQLGAPGLAWGVIVDGQLAASGAVGLREVEQSQPATSSSIFRIASMTKSFTALAILKLRDEGRLSLDDAVTRHIPEFSRVAPPTADAPPITVRHLLTHSGGFPEDNPWGDRQLAIAEQTLSEWLSGGIPFSTSPGTAFEYSNYGFALLGRIVTNVSGVPYGDYIRSQILAPLGMTSTFWDARDAPADRLAHGYRRAGAQWTRETPLAHGAFGAMGGLYTSVENLSRYVAFMLDAWPPRDAVERGPVRRSSVREMQQGQRHAGLSVFRPTPDAPLTARTSAYAYGLGAAQDCRFRLMVSHSGGLPGYGSNMTWLPEHGVGVIVLANVTYAGTTAVTRSMIEALAATGALEARRWPASSHLLKARADIVSLVNGWNDDAAAALAADNLALDRAMEDRKTEVDRLHESLGACAPDGDISAENWLRGSFRLRCERGWITVSITLAPTMPPKVQHLSFSEGRPLGPRLSAAVTQLVAASREGFAKTPLAIASTADKDAVARQVTAFGDAYGACEPGETLSGNGTTTARVRLNCARGTADLTVHATGEGAVEAVAFRAVGTCVP